MSKKSVYESPKTECLVIRFEEGILTTSGEMSAKSWTTGASDWFDDED